MMQSNQYSLEEIAGYVKQWLITGELELDILAEKFIFRSPFWKQASKQEFIDQFQDPKQYIDATLSKIKKFDPIIVLYSQDGHAFSVVLTYYTNNGNAVDEAVLGEVEDGQLTKLLSIYDLADTKSALCLE